jgi:hypothetical protein
MKSGTQMKMKGQNVFDKYLEIKQDLITNLQSIFLKQHTYTHKYRGNLLTDVNVGLDVTDEGHKVIQVFVRNKGLWVRDRLIFDKTGIIKTEFKTNIDLYE